MQVGSMLLITVRSRKVDALLANRIDADPHRFQSFGLELLESIGGSHSTDNRKKTTDHRKNPASQRYFRSEEHG